MTSLVYSLGNCDTNRKNQFDPISSPPCTNFHHHVDWLQFLHCPFVEDDDSICVAWDVIILCSVYFIRGFHNVWGDQDTRVKYSCPWIRNRDKF